MSDKEIEEAFELESQYPDSVKHIELDGFKAGAKWERERKLDSKFKTSALYFAQEEQIKKLEAELKASEFSPKAKFYQERCEWLEKRLAETAEAINKRDKILLRWKDNFFYYQAELAGSWRDIYDDTERELKAYLEKYKGGEK